MPQSSAHPRRNRARSGDPVRTQLLAGSAGRFATQPLCGRAETPRCSRHLGEALWASARLCRERPSRERWWAALKRGEKWLVHSPTSPDARRYVGGETMFSDRHLKPPLLIAVGAVPAIRAGIGIEELQRGKRGGNSLA